MHELDRWGCCWFFGILSGQDKRPNGNSLPDKLAIPKPTGMPAQTATGECITSYSVHMTGLKEFQCREKG